MINDITFDLIMAYIFSIMSAGYFIILMYCHIKNNIKTKVIINNIKVLKGFQDVGVKQWKELERNYIYFDEFLEKNTEGHIYFKRKNTFINKKDGKPDFIRLDVVNEEMINLWLSKKMLLWQHNLLNTKKFKNKLFFPYSINLSQPFYYLMSFLLIFYGTVTGRFEISYLVFTFEFIRVCSILIIFLNIGIWRVIEHEIHDVLKNRPFNFANKKSVARLKPSIYGYYLDYISLYFNKEDNFFPARLDILKNNEILVFPSENTTNIKDYMDLLKEQKINLMNLKESDVDLLKFNFGS